MTPLDQLIRAEIRAQGPIDIAHFMALALGHPTHGYYATRDPFGQAGDFITAPEISQMFGELLGLWAVAVWQGLGRPDPVQLVELGPGRGTLMADALRAARGAPDFLRAIRLNFVETSPVLRQAQARAMRPSGIAPVWLDDLSGLADGSVILLANEFLDALPIRQLIRQGGVWRERLIAWDRDSDRLVFTASPGASPHAVLLDAQVARDAPDGAIAEVCPQALALGGLLGHRLARFGGAALFLDYGHAPSAPGDTLQALRAHAFAPLLEAVGQADLTAHVDFARFALAAAEAGALAFGPVEQGAFLQRLGIALRADHLARAAGPQGAASVHAALTRLTAPDQMGTLFKVLALTSKGSAAPPGFLDSECRP